MEPSVVYYNDPMIFMVLLPYSTTYGIYLWYFSHLKEMILAEFVCIYVHLNLTWGNIMKAFFFLIFVLDTQQDYK